MFVAHLTRLTMRIPRNRAPLEGPYGIRTPAPAVESLWTICKGEWWRPASGCHGAATAPFPPVPANYDSATVLAPGRLAQLGEHQLDKLGVTGSSPVPPI
jgi:hypothetical protein